MLGSSQEVLDLAEFALQPVGFGGRRRLVALLLFRISPIFKLVYICIHMKLKLFCLFWARRYHWLFGLLQLMNRAFINQQRRGRRRYRSRSLRSQMIIFNIQKISIDINLKIMFFLIIFLLMRAKFRRLAHLRVVYSFIFLIAAEKSQLWISGTPHHVEIACVRFWHVGLREKSRRPRDQLIVPKRLPNFGNLNRIIRRISRLNIGIFIISQLNDTISNINKLINFFIFITLIISHTHKHYIN